MTFFYWKHKAKLELTRKEMYTANALVLWRHPVRSTNCINDLIQADLLGSRSGILKNVIPDRFSNSLAQFITQQLTGIVPEQKISLTTCCLIALSKSVLFANHEPKQRHVTKLVTSGWVSLLNVQWVACALGWYSFMDWYIKVCTLTFWKALLAKTRDNR